jgi:hypothetical protein
MPVFDIASLEIVPARDGAIPDVKAWDTRVTCHLTKGYTVENDLGSGMEPAITISARMKAKESDWAGWNFAFIQLHKIKEMGFYYAGKAKSDGSISIYIDLAVPVKLCLDSEDSYKPWTRAEKHYFLDGKLRAASTDHPACRAKRELVNAITSRPNYLFHIVDRRELWTVFAAQDPTGARTYLGHVHWSVDYDFKFKWRKDEPLIASNNSKLSFDDWKKGPPTDSELQPLLKNPGPPLANDVTREAIKNAVIGGPPNRVDVARSFANVFPDFYPPAAA